MTPTGATAQEIIELSQGEKAPFPGALVPAGTFKEMLSDAELKDIYRDEAASCRKDAESSGSWVEVALVSSAIGFAAGVVVSHAFKIP